MGSRPHTQGGRAAQSCAQALGRESSLGRGRNSMEDLERGAGRRPSFVPRHHLSRMNDALPSLRGRLHQHTVWFSLAAATLLIAFAPAGTARLTAVIYGVGLNALFITSAAYHRWPPASRWKPILRR